MAIGTNATVDSFGTQETVTVAGGTSQVLDTAFSASGDVVSGSWINTDDAKGAEIVLTFQYATGTIDVNGIHLYARKMNIDGTSDQAQPDANYKHDYLGTFSTDSGMAATTDVPHPLIIPLKNGYSSQAYEFYIENDCGVTMTAGWTLKITTIAPAPKSA